MFDAAIAAFVTFFVTIDPIGVAPIFVALTGHATAHERRGMALRAPAIAALILLVFAVVGNAFLGWLGVSLAAVRIAGGALLFLLSIDMVLARRSGLRATTAAEDAEAIDREDPTVFPLAIPLIAGPGAITSVILLIGRYQGDVTMQGLVVAVMLAVIGLMLLSLLMAARITRLLGVTGVNVLSRVLGIVLAALAVQLIIDGVDGVIARFV